MNNTNKYESNTVKATGRAGEYVKAAQKLLNVRSSLVCMIVDDLLANRDTFREEFRKACEDARQHDDKGALLNSLRASLNNAYKVLNPDTKTPYLKLIPQYGVQVDKKGHIVIGVAKARNTTSNWVATKATEKLAATIAETGVDANAVAIAQFLAMAGFVADDLEAIAQIMESNGDDDQE